nr:protein TRACHEARY ELEMENT DIFFERENTIATION-RELATED 7A-like [Aegilops tauschii subsp. strangulata]
MVSDDAFDPRRASASSVAAASTFAAVPPPSTLATESPFMASAPLAWARPATSGSHPPAPRSPLARDASLPRDAALAPNSYHPAQPPRDGSLAVNHPVQPRDGSLEVPYGGPYPVPYVAPSSPYVAPAPYASSSAVPYESPYGVPYVAPLQPYGVPPTAPYSHHQHYRLPPSADALIPYSASPTYDSQLSAPVAEPGPFHFALTW